MNRQEILDEINKTKEHLANMEKMLKECNERWKPKENEAYFYIISTGMVEQDLWNRPFDLDVEQRYNFYNCFKTREQAEAEVEKILVRRQLENIAKRLNKSEKIDWNNDSQAKYRIELYCDEIKTNYYFTYKTQGAVYCLDKNFLNTAIKEIGEERLINYLRDE